jgi:hypothetical protein
MLDCDHCRHRFYVALACGVVALLIGAFCAVGSVLRTRRNRRRRGF